jgi:WD40 repeat protein
LKYATRETLTLDPLPCWRHLSEERCQQRAAELVTKIDADAPSRLGGTYSMNHAAVGGEVAVTADQVWERAAGKPLRKLERRATAFAVSPDGSWIAAGGGDGIVRLLEASTGRLHATLRGSASAVTRIVFTPDLSSIAAGRHDGSLSIWSLRPGTPTVIRDSS